MNVNLHKLDNDIYGLKIDYHCNDVRPIRNLIVCINNDNMDKDTFTLCTLYLPNILYQLQKYINYKEMFLVRSYPNIMNVDIKTDEIYQSFNKLSRGNTGASTDCNILNFCMEGIKATTDSGNNHLFDILVLTQCKIYNNLWISGLKKICDSPNTHKLLYISLNGNSAGNNDLHVNSDISCVELGPSINNLNIRTIIDYFCNFPLPNNFEISLNGAQYIVFDDAYKQNSENIYTLDVLCPRCIYLVANIIDINIFIENIVVHYGEEEIPEFDKVIYCRIILESDIDKYEGLRHFAIGLRARIASIYANNHNTNNEIRFIVASLNHKYRSLLNIYMQKKSNNNNNNNSNDEFMNLINLFSQKAGSSTTDPRISEKVNHIILNTMAKLDAHSALSEHDNCKKLAIDDKLDLSREFFSSMITLSDWFDELNTGNTMGIIIGLRPSNDLAKICANGAKPKIDNITTTLLPIRDYLQSAIEIFNKDEDKNLNKNNVQYLNVIQDNVIGNANAVIPIYICADHWKISKKHMGYILGIILANNPFAYSDHYLNFLFYMLAEMTRQSFKVHANNRWTNIYLSIQRTCAQIAFEKGYHKGIVKLITNFVNDDNRILTSRPFDNDVLFGQILSTGCQIENHLLIKLCDRIFENIFWRNIIKYYSQENLTIINAMETNADKINEIKSIVKFIDKNISHGIEIILYNYRMILLMKELFNNIKGFKKFLDCLDDNYGMANDNILQFINSRIKKYDKATSQDLYMTFGKSTEYYWDRMANFTFRALKYPTPKQRRLATKSDGWMSEYKTLYKIEK